MKADFDFKFDFSSLSFKGKMESIDVDEEREDIPKLSYAPVSFDNAEKMANSIDWNKDYTCIVSGSFIFGDFIEALCLTKELAPSCIYITTLGMSAENADSLVNIVDYLGCKKINLIVSHYFACVERHNLMPYMQREFAEKNMNIAVLQSHMKATVILSPKGNVVIFGSANLSSSNNVEQFDICHSSQKVRYFKKRLDMIMDRFTVYSGLGNDTSIHWEKNRNNTGIHAYKAITGDE